MDRSDALARAASAAREPTRRADPRARSRRRLELGVECEAPVAPGRDRLVGCCRLTSAPGQVAAKRWIRIECFCLPHRRTSFDRARDSSREVLVIALEHR